MPIRSDLSRRGRAAILPRRVRPHARIAAVVERLPRFSPVALSLALVATLAVAYIALIATVMSYAALTVSFSQTVRNMEADVAALESDYLAAVSSVADTDYASAGYAKPARETYVPTARATALR